MASSREFLKFILEQISHAEDVSYRPMMGEYLIYCRGKSIGGVYDDRFLVKPTESAKQLMPCGRYEKPYDGAKEMLLVEALDDKDYLKALLEGIADELPDKKKK
ncbi:MAG: competence protein TfoX [Clostridia bacterium]|nr:competence protein TfoX [Clostridia bacterium]